MPHQIDKVLNLLPAKNNLSRKMLWLKSTAFYFSVEWDKVKNIETNSQSIKTFFVLSYRY